MIPLQFGMPGGLELLVIGLFFLTILFAFGLAYWVYNDAERRDNENAAFWALAVGGFTFLTFFGGFLALAVYIWDRE